MELTPDSELADGEKHNFQKKSFKKMFLNDRVCLFVCECAWPSLSVEVRGSLSGIKLRVQQAPVIAEPSRPPEKGDVSV